MPENYQESMGQLLLSGGKKFAKKGLQLLSAIQPPTLDDVASGRVSMEQFAEGILGMTSFGGIAKGKALRLLGRAAAKERMTAKVLGEPKPAFRDFFRSLREIPQKVLDPVPAVGALPRKSLSKGMMTVNPVGPGTGSVYFKMRGGGSPRTVFHEFAHVETYFPRTAKEAKSMQFWRDLSEGMRKETTGSLKSRKEFYTVDPVEELARAVSSEAVMGATFDEAMKIGMKKLEDMKGVYEIFHPKAFAAAQRGAIQREAVKGGRFLKELPKFKGAFRSEAWRKTKELKEMMKSEPLKLKKKELIPELNVRYEGKTDLGHWWTSMKKGEESSFLTKGKGLEEVKAGLARVKEGYRKGVK
jgi:hypothetical protein